MNYLAHALPFFDRPYFMAGSGVPDWLTVADRQSRVRMKQAEPFTADADPIVADVAGGAVQHLRDDLRFHATRAFAETSLELAAAVRRVLETRVAFRSCENSPPLHDPQCGYPGEGRGEGSSRAREKTLHGDPGSYENGPPLPPGEGRGEGFSRSQDKSVHGDPGFRASFLGHLLVELLLDAALAEEHSARLDAYYHALDGIDALVVQHAVNRFAVRPTERLAPFILLFRHERILRDYLDDARLMLRLGQVMRRVGFDPLPDGFPELLPAARELVRAQRHALLDGIPA
jgi:hypothetical protein